MKGGETMNEKVLGQENIIKLFIQYTIPAVISMVLAGSQTMIDGIFVGNYVGANALASVNIVNPFVRISFSVSIIIAFGALSMIGRKLGEGAIEKGQNIFRTALSLLLLFSTIYGVFGVFFSEIIGKWLGADAVLLKGVAIYLRTMAFFMIFRPLMILTGFANRMIGKPQLYLYATLATLVVNAVLDYIFIAHLHLGLMGAGLATGISYAVGAAVTILPLMKKGITLHLLKGHFDVSCIGEMLYNGASEGIGSGATALTTFLFNLEFMTRMGPTGVAAFTTVGFAMNFGSLLIFGIADGMSPIISYNFGSGQLKRVKKTIQYGLFFGGGIGVITCLFLFFGGTYLGGLFAKGSQEVIDLTANGARFLSVAFLFNFATIIYSVYYTSLGQAKSSAIVAFSRGFLWIVIGIKLWPMFIGFNGIWIAVPAAEMLTVVLILFLEHLNPLVKKRPVIGNLA